KFTFPPNVWVGASSPPSIMFGKDLSANQQALMLIRTLTVLKDIAAPVRWMSIEPLSWDMSSIFQNHSQLEWAVIGAATHGRKVHSPKPEWVLALLRVLDDKGTRVFFKGNLQECCKEGNIAWREDFPV